MAGLRGEPTTRRWLEPFSSEDARVGSLGPALFVIIFLGFVVLGLCGAASFIDKPGPRRGLRTGACVLLLLPTIFFSAATYVDDTSQIVANRRIDATYKPRMLALSAVCISIVLCAVSLIAGESSVLLMHRQGRNVFSTSQASKVPP